MCSFTINVKEDLKICAALFWTQNICKYAFYWPTFRNVNLQKARNKNKVIHKAKLMVVNNNIQNEKQGSHIKLLKIDRN